MRKLCENARENYSFETCANFSCLILTLSEIRFAFNFMSALVQNYSEDHTIDEYLETLRKDAVHKRLRALVLFTVILNQND